MATAVGRRRAHPAGGAVDAARGVRRRAGRSGRSGSCSPSATDGPGSSRTAPPRARASTAVRRHRGTSAAITVREDSGVLGIFDRRTSVSAGTLTAVVRDGIAELNRALPFTWPGRVVVYTMDEPDVLCTPSATCPVGRSDHLGAMTFPTYSEAGHSRSRSTRMLLMPSRRRAGQPFPAGSPATSSPRRHRRPRRRGAVVGLRGPRRSTSVRARARCATDHPDLGAQRPPRRG